MADGFKSLIVRSTLLLLLGLSFRHLHSQESGNAVVLVYNSKSPASKQVADHYAAKRKVAPEPVNTLPVAETEIIPRGGFEAQLQQPLWNEMRARKLLTYRSQQSTQQCNVVEAKVRYAVLCYGVPVKIASDPNRNGEANESLPVELRRNEAAVDSELALLPLLDRKVPITGLIGNPSFGATNSSVLHPINGVMMVARLDGP